MTRLGGALRVLAADLDALGVPWAVVGGLALRAHGVEWYCPDVDIAVNAAGDGAVDALAEALRERGHTVLQSRHDALGEVVVVHPRVPGEAPAGVLFDLLPGASGFEAEIVAAARPTTVLGVAVPVARIGHLIAYKVKAMHDVRRARDRRHLKALLALAAEGEISVAREALRLSAARGALRMEHRPMWDPLLLDGGAGDLGR